MKKRIIYKNTIISYTLEGKGSAIVLLHGFLEDSSMWLGVKELLMIRSKVITIDLLGHGDSDCLGYVHAMEEMAEVVKTVVKQEKIRRVKIIGHSMGGYVSLAFAEKYPKYVKGLCLMNSTAQEDTEERKENRLRAIKMAQTNYDALVSMSVTNLFSKGKRILLSEEIEEAKKTALKTSVQAYIATSEGMRIRKNREDVLKNAAFKKLLIIGESDSVLNSVLIIEEAKRTKTPFKVLPNGHMSHLENQKELMNILVNF